MLAARLDRLDPGEKALLQQLAVVGREFSLGLLRQVIAQPEDDLYRLLSALQRKEFLYEQPAFPEPEYVFKHALTQEVAYKSVLIERRKTLHEQTGQAIQQLYYDQLDEHYSKLAPHYSRSGNTEKAIEYLHKAGQQAAQRSANVEAIGRLTTAWELLKTLPDSRRRDQQELTLQIALGALLITTKGYGSSAAEHLYTQARALCLRLDETQQLFPTLWGLWVFYLIRGALPKALELCTQRLALAHDLQDSTLLLEAHIAYGETSLFISLKRMRKHDSQKRGLLYWPKVLR